MQHCTVTHCVDKRRGWRIHWRKPLTALLDQAERLHRYRNLRSAMFADAVRHYDCGNCGQCGDCK